jgi:hypothetical protein
MATDTWDQEDCGVDVDSMKNLGCVRFFSFLFGLLVVLHTGVQGVRRLRVTADACFGFSFFAPEHA